MKSKTDFYISAIYTSPPNTMGGNTKIMVEMINTLIDTYNFVIFTSEPQAFRINIKDVDKVTIVPIPFNYVKFNFLTHFAEINYINKYYLNYFRRNTFKAGSLFYSCSDFAPDVLPIFSLKKKYEFDWIASLFLFIPDPIENLVKGYGFPFFKYIIYFIYQRILFLFMLSKADLFFITNKYDLTQFPNKLRNKVLPIYGGVNDEQIIKAESSPIKTYDAVYCSRLHPQKGVLKLLEIWQKVICKIPDAKLAIIGNGEREFEHNIKNKSVKMGLKNNIKWLGYVNGVEKFKIYKKSKIFIHATIYDNNGMVAAEALCTGLPVIMFDLPQLKHVYDDGCLKITPYDTVMFSNSIIDLLQDKIKYDGLKPTPKMVKNITEKWVWKNKSKVINKFLENH